MIWDNSNKKVRRSTWFTVQAPDRFKMKKAAAWCRKFDSVGKFYYHYTNTRWWFELESDAIMFSLKWAS